MVHFCICGGHSGQLSSGKRLYITLLGACELTRPTVARQIVEARHRGMAELRQRGHFFLTVCGGTGLKYPTLAQEYLELQDALRAGLLTLDEWDRAVGQLASHDSVAIGSFTLCGAFEAACLPTEDEELDGLAVQRHTGQIPERAGNLLIMAVGQAGAQRPSCVRQAMAASLSVA